MNTQFLLAALVLTSVALAPAKSDETVPFARVYKAGDKTVYSTVMEFKAMGPGQSKVDIAVTTAKVLEKGRASLLFHWSNLILAANTSGKIPADVTVNTSENGMPGKFEPTMGSMDFLVAMLQLAGAVADKSVKVGAETPFAWGGDKMAFKGSVKLIEVNADKKQIKTLVKAALSIQGAKFGDITFNSIEDIATCRLISSVGGLDLGGASQDFKFTAKP